MLWQCEEIVVMTALVRNSLLQVLLALGVLPTSLLAVDAQERNRHWEAVFATAPGEGPVNRNWERWDKYRAQYALAKKTDQGAVVFLGDSITFHWNLAKAFPGLKTANRGLSGDTTRGMLYRLQEDVLDLHPRLIVLLAGVNDLSEAMAGRGGSPETIASNIRLMLAHIESVRPGTPVIVCEIMPAKKRGLELANSAVAAVVAQFPHARRLAWAGRFHLADGTQNLSLFKDGTHPNGAGYAVWQAALAPELERLLGSGTSPSPTKPSAEHP